MRAKNVEPLVLETLEKNELARKDTFILYGAVLKRLGYDLNISLGVFLANASKNRIPPFESVARARRKIIETRPELNDNVEMRAEEEIKYRDYAREGLNYGFNEYGKT